MYSSTEGRSHRDSLTPTGKDEESAVLSSLHSNDEDVDVGE